jgi:hypothetical protein
MIEPLGAATARAQFERPATLNAPLFRSLVERLDKKRRIVVLDLGAVHTQTIAAFSGHRCRLEIADLAEGLDQLQAVKFPAAFDAAVASVLPRPGAEPADVVLGWDLLNYLDRPALTALMAEIARRMRPGGLVHALIVYSDSRMPARPRAFAPLEDLQLNCLNAGPAPDRPAPRYIPEDLSRCMPDFTTERGRLLSNGMQEFLFRR